MAAGFAPLALATETDGSIVQPANRASLYGLKATVGLIPTEGTAPWSALTDSIGGMARTPGDLANLLGILLNDTNLSARTTTDTWEGQRVGFVDPTLWGFVPFICNPDNVLTDQQRRALADAANTISGKGGFVEQPVPLTSMDELVLDGEDALEQLWSTHHPIASGYSSTTDPNLQITTLSRRGIVSSPGTWTRRCAPWRSWSSSTGNTQILLSHPVRKSRHRRN